MKQWNSLTNKWYEPKPCPRPKRSNRKAPKAWDYSRETILRRDNNRCLYCGNRPSLDPQCKLVLDHVHPYIKGGTGTANNIVTACYDCNASKHSKELSPDVLNDITAYLERVNCECGLKPDGTIEGVAL